VSSSKLECNRLFSRINVPSPLSWPDCDLPLIAKPNTGSGSQAVAVIRDSQTLKAYLQQPAESWVLQEYVQGPSYSIEVLGIAGQYSAIQVTDLQMDPGYDCKRVLAPTDLSQCLITDFEQISISLAEALALHGLMDVEVILHQDSFKVLEIDARLPSQTPTTVFWSTGLNMVQMLAGLFQDGDAQVSEPIKPPQGVVYEHIKVSPDSIAVAGEHIMSGAQDLKLYSDFFGADEAITNYTPGRTNWVATLIICEPTREAAWDKRNGVMAEIRKRFNLDIYRDLSPTENPGRKS
jgi:pyrrolysine biosynthesis protein PylC